METLALQPPLLGESRSMEELRDFIIAVSLREEPVLVTGPAGAGKTLVAGKIHAIGPHATFPCVRQDAATLEPDRLEGLLAPVAGLPLAALILRHADLLAPTCAARIADHLALAGALPRILLVSRHAAGSEAWAPVERCGLFPEPACLHASIPPLVRRPEDIAAISRYQIWLHSLPERFEARWEAFEAHLLPHLLDRPWPGNVAELIDVVVAHCGGNAEFPRRWAGESGRRTAQEEFLRRELDAAFEGFRAEIALGRWSGAEWLLPRAPRALPTEGSEE